MNIEIILQILLILIGFYLAFFKSYFTEKGKNIATSEDIEDLTTKIESVKQKFIEKNSVLKSKLDLLTNLQIGHKNDERSALIQFHKSISKWLSMLTSGSINLINSYDNNEIERKMFDYNEAYQEVIAANSLLVLYVADEELDDAILQLKLKTLDLLSVNPMTTMINLKQNNNLVTINEQEVNFEKKAAKHEELLNERTRIHSTYKENMLSGYKEVVILQKKYESRLRHLLKNLLSES